MIKRYPLILICIVNVFILKAQELIGTTDDCFILLHPDNTWEEVELEETINGQFLLLKEDGTFLKWSPDDGFTGSIDRESKLHGQQLYDDTDNEIVGRRIIYRNIYPILDYVSSLESCKMVFKVCINPQGIINYVELIDSATTITDYTILKTISEYVYQYKFESDPNAANEECGRIRINIDKFN